MSGTISNLSNCMRNQVPNYGWYKICMYLLYTGCTTRTWVLHNTHQQHLEQSLGSSVHHFAIVPLSILDKHVCDSDGVMRRAMMDMLSYSSDSSFASSTIYIICASLVKSCPVLEKPWFEQISYLQKQTPCMALWHQRSENWVHTLFWTLSFQLQSSPHWC